LEKRVQALGIKRIQGEFLQLDSSQTAQIALEGKTRSLPYQLLIGADGTQSRTRDAIGIKKQIFGKAVGWAAILSSPADKSLAPDISDALAVNQGFIRRMRFPSVSIVFGQFPEKGSKEQFAQALEWQGWSEEAKAVREKEGFLLSDIPIELAQTERFSNPCHAAILVGDATASASFFQGMGANTALRSAEIAGHFFATFQKDPDQAYRAFEEAMRANTDALIADSAFLFEENAFPQLAHNGSSSANCPQSE
jgi:2-polyprenyl-6-methoxyphenol hydroxylase-like FAD-dependent oxidoreductase